MSLFIHLLAEITMPAWGKAPRLREQWLRERAMPANFEAVPMVKPDSDWAMVGWKLRPSGKSLEELARGAL